MVKLLCMQSSRHFLTKTNTFETHMMLYLSIYYIKKRRVICVVMADELIIGPDRGWVFLQYLSRFSGVNYAADDITGPDIPLVYKRYFICGR
jgi:hypothetical protein